ncbi:hypothetical protein [Sphingomonas hengshuiensis]|uniref:Uncharacterized protein n=1 Tax=Sphingomonas hengshuiensis TaxID=1609977 RepID=A0A7U5BE99_9SPHN|nr:hypothetical protein [Sphingomonas hengshuiensis]AJP70702.1 hypothetical protein TS85_00985 [Sphingomonas hengshuiensis]
MYSDAERAAFAALLNRARANEAITEDEVEAVLPAELAEAVVARAIVRGNSFYEQYDELAADYGQPPPAVQTYRAKLRATKNSYRAAPAKIEKLRPKAHALVTRIQQAEDELANSKARMWAYYDQLPRDVKIWAEQGSEQGGWPPEMAEIAPPAVVMPHAELPVAYGVSVVLAAALGEEP